MPTWSIRCGGFWKKTIWIRNRGVLLVHWLRLCTPNGGDPGLVPGQGTRSHIPQLRPGTTKEINLGFKKKKKRKLREPWSLISKGEQCFKPDPENQGSSDSCPHLWRPSQFMAPFQWVLPSKSLSTKLPNCFIFEISIEFMERKETQPKLLSF